MFLNHVLVDCLQNTNPCDHIFSIQSQVRNPTRTARMLCGNNYLCGTDSPAAIMACVCLGCGLEMFERSCIESSSECDAPSDIPTSAPHRPPHHTFCQQVSTRNQGSPHVGVPAVAAWPPVSALRSAIFQEIAMPNPFGGPP